ncbi:MULTISPECIES: cation:proton antiporter [Thermococcus]|uniref:NapA-type sodium/hydrogen antiporter n=1 Tax=Thermococcus sibiricus (strain DSM 12597 / MM 739) TaxID=604354 RepID=C6A1M2_THESM|nr:MULTISPECIES: cation:proton antiporter [Thermococcus]ACS89517.1 NapA-type sodium/hydrogen antiporter [Thermococcus sibiricus MM 739]KUK28405.1 MAG: NapA-type sodium/hydrogen antiporter [Thermococcus sp. 40_45]MBC7094739.1 cation:proton antiporter [Thermococcus sp.]HII66513.1 cation:proton antiporter [Thermococcaceae archaeon]
MDVFLELAVILIVAKLFGYIATKAKMPGALGQLIGGMLIGPSILNIVSYSEGVHLISEIGVVLLLFLAGLETDVEEFKRVGVPSFLIALGGVAIPFVMGYFLSEWFGYERTEALFLGGILTATSVGLTVSILMEMKKLRTKEGTAILAGAVVDDILGIILLTTLIAMYRKGHVYIEDVGILIGEVAVFFVVSWLVGKPIVKEFLSLSERIDLPETLTAFALAITLIFAYIAEQFRIAGITGAYLAGVLIAQTDEAKRISNRMITVSYSLFVPVFLVGIGIKTDISIILHAGTFAILYSVIAIIGKIVGCGVGALLARFKPKEALRVGIGMIPRMEVALIMANVALTENVFDKGIFSIPVTMVIITTIITPPLLKWIFSRD